MLSRALAATTSKSRAALIGKTASGMTAKNVSLVTNAMRAFSHGPYNPLSYKTMLVPEDMPT